MAINLSSISENSQKPKCCLCIMKNVSCLYTTRKNGTFYNFFKSDCFQMNFKVDAGDAKPSLEGTII